MTAPAVASFVDVPVAAPAPSVVRTLEDSGLSANQLEQLLIKSLYVGEASGPRDLGSHVPAVHDPRAAHRAGARRAADRSPRRRGTGHRRLPLRADRPRPRSRAGSSSTSIGTSVPRPCRSRSTSPYVRALHGVRAATSIAIAAPGLRAPDRRRRHARAARPGGERRQGAVPLRPARQRQDRDRPKGIGRALGGDMYVPHAIDVDGQIITMFDPVNHERARRDATSSRA